MDVVEFSVEDIIATSAPTEATRDNEGPTVPGGFL
jgi:hypothetical protein